MDPARAAAMSDPDRNPFFRRHWVEPAARPPTAIRQDIALEPFEQIGLQLRETWRQERAGGQKGKSA